MASKSPLGLNATRVGDFLGHDERPHLGPFGHVPDPRGLVGRGRGRQLAVRAEGHAVDLAGVARERLGPGRRKRPECDVLVGGAGKERGRVGRERKRAHRGVCRLIARQLGLLGIGDRDVEDLHRAVRQSSRRHRVVGRRGDGVDARRQVRNRQQRLAVAGVPDAKRLVVRARDDLASILRERDRLDGAGVTGERSDDVPIVDVEDLDRLVRRRREKLRSRRDARPR